LPRWAKRTQLGSAAATNQQLAKSEAPSHVRFGGKP